MPDKQTDLVKTDFVNYLNSLGLSPRSHKNYRSDLGHFIAWAIFKVRSFGSYVETLAEIVPFLNNDLGHEYASYMTENLVPAKTINRRLSTLRHLSRFLQASHAIDNDFTKGIENISAVTVKKTVVDPAIGNFKAHLVNKNVSPNTIKNYLSDIRHFLVWLENNNQQLTNPMSLLPKITPDLIRKYQEDLTSHFSAATVRRKSISVGKFLDWAKSQGIIDSNLGDFFSTQKPVENIIPVKSAENSRFKNWYKTYRNIPGVMYLNIAVALILTSLVGLGIYNQFFKNAKSPLALTALNRPSRYLSFQGRLTNQYGNPVITSRDVVFKLYNDPGAGTTLWDSGTCTVLPDADGVFSILLGSTCGTELTSSVFSDNAGVWLGVKVASDAEATPRVQIATVAYALNSETLQGYPASSSATINTIPVINNSGQMVLASSSPKIQSTSGTFAIEGQALTISTPSTSNGNVTVSPDGTGQLNLTFSGASPGSGTGMVNATDANLTSGALYYGSVASNATGYDLLQLQSGSSPTTTKFSVNDAGKTYIAGNLGIGTTNPGAKLEVAGQVKITGGSPGSNKVLTSDTVGLASWADLSTLPVGNADTTDNYHISSATTNYLTKYTDSTHLGASGIFEVSGNVGIGTTGPMGTLDVNGTIFLKGNSILESDGTNHYFKSPSYLYFQSGGSTSGYISNFHNLVMNGTGTFGTNAVINGGGVSYFNGGNVGIGTTGPNAKLDVNGNVIIANPSGEAYLTLGTNNVASGFVNSVNSLYFNTDSDNTETGTNFIFGTNRAGTAGGTELMRIQENGNVGIGTTGPGAKLEVNGNAIIDGYIQSYSTTPYVDFYQSGVQEWKVGQLTAGNSRFTIQATGAANPDVFSILANGNVGIGTTAPLIKLDVNGGVNIAGGLLVANSAEMVTNGTFDTNTNGWAGGDATVSVVSGVMRGTNTYAWGGWAFTSPDIKVVAGRRYKLTLTCTGASVACGVMAGSSDWTDNLLSHTALVVGVPKTFYITATNTVLWIGLSIGGVSGDTADFDNISLVEVGDIITPAEGFVGPSSTAGIYFKSGNIGIGTTGPGAPFEVSSTNFFQQKLTYPAAGSLSLGVNSSGIGVISRSGGFDLSLNSSGYAGFGYSDAGTAQVAINGNVGIGTTSPQNALEIANGNLLVSDTTSSYLDNNDPQYKTTINGALLAEQLNIVQRTNLMIASTYYSTANTGWSPQTGTSTITATTVSNKQFKNNAVLQITGTTPVDRVFASTGAQTAEFVQNHRYRVSFRYTAINSFTVQDRDDSFATVPANTGNAKYFSTTFTNTNTNGCSAGNTCDLVFIINNNTVNISELTVQDLDSAPTWTMVADSTGNVGIGTTNPGATLDVAGKIKTSTFQMTTGGTSGYVMQSDVSGNGSWASLGSLSVGNADTTDSYHIGGTANYVTKFNSSNNTIVNSSIFDNGNVGIGTTNPLNYLQVTGGSTVAYFTNNNFNAGTNTGSLFEIGFGTSTNSTYTELKALSAGYSAWNNLVLQSGGGNVGIGTTNPTATFVVETTGQTDTQIRAADGSVAQSLLVSGTDYWRFRHNADNLLDISYNGTQTAGLAITTIGNVGIGTANPTAKLDIRGDMVSPTGMLQTPYGGMGRYENLVTYSEQFDNAAWNTTTLTVTADNTTAPNGATTAELLTPASSDSQIYQNVTIATSGYWTFSVWLKSATGSNVSTSLYLYNGSLSASNAVTVTTNWQRFSLSYNAVGDEGITRFIVGAFNTLSTGENIYSWGAQVEKSSTPGIYAKTVASTIAASRGVVSTGDILASGNLQVTGAGPHYISSGNVGIGTTNPLYQLDVTGTTRITSTLNLPSLAASSALYTDGSSNLTTSPPTGGTLGYWQRNGTNLSPSTISDNVGIGTTSPGYKLDVSGSGRFTGALNVGTATGTNEGSLNLAGAYAGISLASQTGSGATWSIYDSAGTLNYYNGGASSKVVFDTNGNVGIGTTSPTAKLYISSSTGNLFTINDTVGDLVNVSSAQTTINNPTFFTSSGDVSITYDLLFSNSDSSYIKSVASLYIQAGETYDSSDLTLRTFNSGDIVMDAGGVTSATGTVRFNDSNVKGATVTTPIGFAAASSDINTFRTNFTNETVIGSINEAYAAAIGGGGGLWLDGGSYAYPNSAYVTDVMVPSGNVGIGTTSPGSKLDVQSADNTGATNIGSFYASNRTQAVGIGFQDVRQQAAGVQLNVNAGTSGILYLGNTSTGGVNIGAGGGGVNMTGAVTGGTYNGQTISSAANFTGSLTMAGTFTRDTMRYITESRSLTQTAGDWVNVGSFANNGVGNFGKITVYTHTSGTIQMASYSFAHDAYSGGSSATWIELPPDGPNSLYGDAQTVAVDVYNADRNSTSSPIEVRLRNKTGFGATAGVTVLIETNAAFTASTTSGSGATAANGYLGSKQWMFPTSTGPWNATTDGLYILSSGNVGIGTTSPAGKLQIDTDTTTGGTALILKTNNSTTANSAILWRNNADVTKSGIGSSYNVGDTGNMEFMTGGATTNMIITSGGNVGIGTTSPGANLQVNSTTGTGMIRVSGVGEGSSDIGGIEFLHSSYNANPIASIVMHRTPTAASGTLAFRTAYTGTPADRLTISAWGAVGIGYDASAITDAGNLLISGNVGIGTTSPTELLHLYGTGNVRNYLQTTSGAAVAISFYQNADRAWSSGIRGDISDGYSIRDESVATDRLFINTSGNVGIGTTSPGAKLQVYNASAGQAIFSGWDNVGGAQTYNGSIALGDTAAYQGIIHYNGAGVADLYIDNTYSSSAIGKTMFRMQTAGTPITAMTINGSGNVGIGTTNPQSRLHVSSLGSGDGNLVQRWSYNGGDGDYYLDLKQTVTSGVVRWNFSQLNATTPYNDVLVLDRGNVGIGTTNPGAKLEVAGTIKIVDGSQGANEVLTSDANGLASWQPVGTAMITDDSLDFTKFEDTMDLDANLILNQAAYTWTQNYTGTTTNGYTYNANSLTSGTGMVLSSTSTALSTGGLMSLDWSPASSTTSTGDLLSLNIGTNGNIGNIFNVKDSGSSLFSVSETAVTSNLPTSFTSPGDITVAYDLNFTNPTASYIKSSAPLYLQAGEVFNSSDLTLKTFNSGNIVMDAGGSTSATGTVLFNDSNVKGATVTTPIGFAAASSDINTFRTNFTNETVIGSINEAYSAAIGGGGGIWTDAGTYIYPTAGGATAMAIMDNGNVGIGTTAPSALLDVAGKIESSTFQMTTGGAASYFMQSDASGNASWVAPSSISIGNADTLDTYHGGAAGSYVMSGVAGNWDVASSAVTSSYPYGALEIREAQFGGAQTGVAAEAPRISFHWSGRVASQIGMDLNGVIRTYDNPGTSYEAFAASRIDIGATNVIDASRNLVNVGTITAAGAVNAPNFRDSTGDYNVNLGSGGIEGRGLVAGYSGGAYGGIGYNIRHTGTTGTYIAPTADTASYIRFTNAGFEFLGAAGGSAGRTLSLASANLTASTYTSNVATGTAPLTVSSTTTVSNLSADLIDGIQSNRIVYGDGARGKSTQVSTMSDLAQPSGFYYGYQPTGAPVSDWMKWITLAGDSWTDPDGYALQLAQTFWSDSLYMRRLQSGTWYAWQKLLSSADISGTTNYVAKFTGANSLGDSTIFDNGNVGIGTTGPTEKLDIAGNLRFSGALMPNNAAGTSGQFLISAGTGAPPTWTATVPATSVPFSGITSGTNVTAAMVVGTGASLTYHDGAAVSGEINASLLQNANWAAPLAIGGTTANTGAFTTLTAGANSYRYNTSQWAYSMDAGANNLFSYAGSMPSYDVFEYATVNSVEYYSGGWTTWSGSNMENAFDHNVQTGVTVDATHQNFRFVIDHGSYSCQGLYIIERSYASPNPDYTITIETDDNTGFTSPTTIYSGSALTSQEMSAISANSCNADEYLRMQINSTQVYTLLEISALATRGSNGANLSAYKQDYNSPYVSSGLAVGYSNGQTVPSNGLVISGNVGIGTVVPRGKLEVVSGSANTDADPAKEMTVVGPNNAMGLESGNLQIATNDAVAANMGGSIAFGARYSGTAQANFAVIKAGLVGSYGGYLTLGTRPDGGVMTEWIRIKSDGNVGIGTTNPGYKLDVSGTARITGVTIINGGSSSNWGGLNVGGSIQNSGSIYSYDSVCVGNASGGCDSTGGVVLGRANGTVSLTTGVSYFNGGNVGIGTTSPVVNFQVGAAATSHSLSTNDALFAADLELDGVLYLDGRTITSSNGTSTITFPSDPTTAGAYNLLTNGSWMIQNPSAGNPGLAALMVDQIKGGDIFTASASGAPKFVINNSGNVGIGTTSPSTRLEISGAYDTGESRLTFIGTGVNAGWIGPDSSARALRIYAANSDLRTFTVGNTWMRSNAAHYIDLDDDNNGTTDKLWVRNGADGTIMVAEEAGNVGIGTDSPATRLSVIGGGISTDSFYSFTSVQAVAPPGHMTYINAPRSLNLGLFANGVEALTINSSHYVGIGTTSPLQKLHVDGRVYIAPVLNSGNTYEDYRGFTVNTGTMSQYASLISSYTTDTVADDEYSFASGTCTSYDAQGDCSGGASKFTVSTSGKILAAGVYGTTVTSPRNVYVDSSGNFGGISSSLRFKQNILDMGEQSDKLYQLRPVTFEYKSNPGTNEYGLIAEEMVKIFPELTYFDDQGLPSGIAYDRLPMIELNEIIKHQNSITNLQSGIATLSGQLANLSLTSTGDLNISQDVSGNYQLTNTSDNSIISQIAALGQLVAANIKAGAITTTDFVAENVNAGAVIASRITTDGFTAFQGTVDNLLIRSGLVAGNIQTKLISPLADGTDVTVQIGTATESGKFAVQNSAGTEVASIDNQGNASFSGTLYADEIKSKSLDEIQALLTKVQTDQALLAEAATWNINTATNSASLNELAVADLYITNQAAINSLSVSTVLTVGSDMVFQSTINNQQLTINSIDTLTAPLKLQSLAMAPLEIMAGLVTIDTHGNVNIAGNLFVAGKIHSSGLALTQSTQDQLNGVDATDSGKLLTLQDQAGTEVASVNASGSAQFNSLSTQGLTIAGADATQSGIIVNGIITTNSTAGKATIPTGVSEITIKNPKVTDYTLVYVTPTSSTQNNVLYVKSKEAGQFVVGFAYALDADVSFNWWIIQTNGQVGN